MEGGSYGYFVFNFPAHINSKVLGTPTEATWSGVSLLPDYAPQEWPNYKKQRLATQVPRLCNLRGLVEYVFIYILCRLSRLGLDLLEQLLQCDPKQRPPAQTAMAHEYFRALQIPPNLHPGMLIYIQQLEFNLLLK